MISPCRACGSASFWIVPRIALSRAPPGAIGAVFCECGRWLKWPSANELRAWKERVRMPVECPAVVQRTLADMAKEDFSGTGTEPRHRRLL